MYDCLPTSELDPKFIQSTASRLVRAERPRSYVRLSLLPHVEEPQLSYLLDTLKARFDLIQQKDDQLFVHGVSLEEALTLEKQFRSLCAVEVHVFSPSPALDG